MRKESVIFGYSIYAEIVKLDFGWDVGVFGGCSIHIGAVSMAERDGTVQTLERSKHKESCISERWACVLAKELKEPVSVRCGIHYDKVTKEQLKEIVVACDELLQDVIRTIKEEA